MRKKLKICLTVSIDTDDPEVPCLRGKLDDLERMKDVTRDIYGYSRNYLSQLLGCDELTLTTRFPNLLLYRAICQDCSDDD